MDLECLKLKCYGYPLNAQVDCLYKTIRIPFGVWMCEGSGCAGAAHPLCPSSKTHLAPPGVKLHHTASRSDVHLQLGLQSRMSYDHL